MTHPEGFVFLGVASIFMPLDVLCNQWFSGHAQ
jgi:hypothetical protein